MSAKNKLIISGVGIGVLVIAFIVALVLSIQKPEKPQETAPTAPSISQNELQNYLKVSTKSWTNDALFGSIDLTQIERLYFVYQAPSDLKAEMAWFFDGLNCYYVAGNVYVEVGYGIKIMGSMNGAFANLVNLKEIQGLSSLKTENVADMSYLFANCSSLQNIQIQELDTSNLVLAKGMFEGCASLISLDMGGMDFTNVLDLDYMFANCKALDDLRLPKTMDFTTAKYMFKNIGISATVCTQVVGELSTANCKYADYMFEGARMFDYSLAERFDTTNLVSAEGMFANAGELRTIDLSQWKTNNLVNVKNMFFDDTMLKSCNVGGWNADNIQYCDSMFSLCSSLRELDISWSNVDIIHSATNMFSTCLSLENINFTAFDNTKFGNATRMFYDCNNLQNIICVGFEADVSDEMFRYCSELPNYTDGKWYVDMATIDGYFVKEINANGET